MKALLATGLAALALAAPAAANTVLEQADILAPDEPALTARPAGTQLRPARDAALPYEAIAATSAALLAVGGAGLAVVGRRRLRTA